jgi:hypothetical protein
MSAGTQTLPHMQGWKRLALTGVFALAAAAALAAAWAALAPLEGVPREALFEIPQGTWARRMAGDPVEILPDTIRLTLGVQDLLQLRNLDDVPQMFGPTLMMPGQSFRLPFARAGTYDFACTAHASGQMRIIVDPYPATPWARLAWRARIGIDTLTGRAARGSGQATFAEGE